MRYEIEKVNISNHHLFDDMVFWREHGVEREPSSESVPEQIKIELENPNLYIYAVKEENRYVGWISLIYMPKVERWSGHGHVYIDELWIQPSYWGKGLAKILMDEAAEAVILGCTEIGMLIKQEDSVLPIYDTTVIHATRAAQMACE